MGVYPSTHKTLLMKIQDGDEVSWKEFYDRYSSAILTISGRFGLNPTEADEVRQNVMLKIFQNKLIFSYNDERARFRTYFNRIVRSCIVDYFRKKKAREPETALENLPDQPAPDDAVNSEEIFEEEWRKQCLIDALDILKEHVEPRTFLAFHMTAFQQKKVREVAGFLQMNASQVYLSKSRCIAKLQNIISELQKKDPDLNLRWDGK
jgi:RNA polymerase sigma-70 factor (ECF subfamily)